MAEPIRMPFGLWAGMGRRNRVGWGSIGAEGRCHGNQFWDAICYNWLWRLMGYNFGCMIASDTQFDSRGGVFGVKLSDEDIAEIECQRVVAMATNFGFYICRAHWRHLKNMTEPSMCGGDVALCQITLTTCCLFLMSLLIVSILSSV